MPVNKAARFRFEIIDACLRNTKKKWTKAELLSYVNREIERHYDQTKIISVSQLRYDIAGMQTEYGAPIEMIREGKRCYYQYEDPSFSIRTIPISTEDIDKLQKALQFLNQFDGFSFAEDIADVVEKLEGRRNQSDRKKKIVLCETAYTTVRESAYLEDIYTAINRRNVLRIRYNLPHTDSCEDNIVHPYLLKEYDKKWFLLGYSHEQDGLYVYSLENITSIKVINHIFFDKPAEIAEAYFNDMIGITRCPERSSIILNFSAAQAQHIVSCPLHASQKILLRHPDGSTDISIDVCINPELISLLLKYGKNVKVLQPLSLAEEIYQTALDLVTFYKHA
ncbi:helix-turn-helix transcriptional regulator [Chitinophagaceae bacterium MMS25-I14]